VDLVVEGKVPTDQELEAEEIWPTESHQGLELEEMGRTESNHELMLDEMGKDLVHE
jgi:hypothetical protein